MLAEPPEISCCFASLKVNDKYQNYCKIKNILVCSLENLLLLNLKIFYMLPDLLLLIKMLKINIEY